MPEHCSIVPKSLLLIEKQAMLDTGSYHACRALRTQTQAFTITVLEAIHFLFNDVRYFTDRAFEQPAFLNNWRSYLLVTKTLDQLSPGVFQLVPGIHVLRQYV